MFNPNKNFLSLTIVKVTVLLCISFSLCLIYIIIKNGNLEFNPSYEGINLLVAIFKVPLAILAFMIPILMLFSAAHRSEQTKEQIRESRSTNRISNYFQHIEEFEKYMVKVEGLYKDIDFQGSRRLHKVLFPKAKNGDFRLCKDLLEKIKYLIYYLADSEQKQHKSYVGIYTPRIDVVSSIEHGLGSEIDEVSFLPRPEIFITGLYGLLGVIDKNYFEKVKSTHENKDDHEKIIECYSRAASVITNIIQFAFEEQTGLLPGSKNEIYNLDLNKYTLQKIHSERNVEVTFFPFGMVHKVNF